MDAKIEKINADVLIIGGGTAGCLAAVEIKEKNPELKVVIMEKAQIERSGCLASGMNAINVHINPGETPESFVKYVRYDAMGLIREDLVLSLAKEVNPVVQRVEKMGLPILKDDKGVYAARGRWNIKINGESLKPILAQAVKKAGATVLNKVVATNFILKGDKVAGAFGFGVKDGKFYVIQAKATIVCTGGASGVYKPNTDGSGHHKMWYPPFNTGAGYAMGIRAGAEMTSFEMRFIALRTKDMICPTGTLALGFGAPQVNGKGERFMKTKYAHFGGEGAPTCLRAYGPTLEVKEGRGPCFMDTRHLGPEKVRELKAAYLDMYPGVVLYWTANKFDPSKEPIEICGTEPYIVGGHCQAGYWINEDRTTTLKGLFAAGDVAGGAPYKFVSGCWAEGVIAGRSVTEYVKKESRADEADDTAIEKEIERVWAPVNRQKDAGRGVYPREMEERLQKVMDEYAGGISTFYEINEERLQVAKRHIKRLKEQIKFLAARDLHELMLAHEVIDRVDLAEVLLEHLSYRKETRWPGFQTRLDYPNRDDFNWLKFINSCRDKAGEIKIMERPYKQLIPGDRYLPKG
ncbi:MAG: adenylyl-sulfate reductase subunit alpha [Candidatus Omnitrophica bacterium]|nr:adenylyl-sulfate reductase subunit alpha [Candidatus Omnitrophota bacterium]